MWHQRSAAVAVAGLAVAVGGVGVAAALTAEQPTRTAAKSPSCKELVAAWSPRKLAEQVTTISVESTDIAAIKAEVKAGAGAIILFGDTPPSNLGSQLRALDKAAPGGIKPIVMTDEEGGEVQRVAPLVGSLPWPRTVAKTETVAGASQQATAVARKMKANAITMNLAPVLDLSNGPGPDATHPDGQRSYSLKPTVATDYGIAFAKAMQAGGEIPVVKHFPGLGTANNNTDTGPATTKPLSYLKQHDLKPFEAAIKAKLPAVMVSNAIVPGLNSLPASLSYNAVTTFLGHKLGFHGLVVTDALSAGAIRDAGYTPQAAAVKAMSAGIDLILNGGSKQAGKNANIFNHTVTSLVDAVNSKAMKVSRLQAAVRQILAVKKLDGCTSGS